MSRICVRCGWLVLEGDRCKRDGGPTLSEAAAGRACNVPNLRRLLNLEPELRVSYFRITGDRLLETRRRGRARRPYDREAAR